MTHLCQLPAGDPVAALEVEQRGQNGIRKLLILGYHGDIPYRSHDILFIAACDCQTTPTSRRSAITSTTIAKYSADVLRGEVTEIQTHTHTQTHTHARTHAHTHTHTLYSTSQPTSLRSVVRKTQHLSCNSLGHGL